ITESTARWRGAGKAFYFGAPPQAADCLARAGVDLVSLANNHALDFDYAGLADTFRILQARGIAWAGAGEDERAATSVATLARGGLRFGMAAFCDHQQDFAAGPATPGIAWLDLADEAGTLHRWRAALDDLHEAGVNWPILSLHWGSNLAIRPPQRFRRLAHAAIDMGWRILFGHSAHVYQGVELYRGCPILYAAGDLVDDYYVDPELRNDLQFLFELELDAVRLRAIRMWPLRIDDCRSEPADPSMFAEMAETMIGRCAELGTPVERIDGSLQVAVPEQA
ncbi:MAG TPA: CapA family protein, partial [Noviherbaspirillum sp.]|nr:CapA family protein [Noviherbaspirillum sp.]